MEVCSVAYHLKAHGTRNSNMLVKLQSEMLTNSPLLTNSKIRHLTMENHCIWVQMDAKSNGFARPDAHLLALLSHSLAPDCSHCSLIRLLQIARFARTLRCAYSLTCLWNESVDSIQLQVVTYNPLCTIQAVQATHIIPHTAGTARIFTHILILSRRSTS